MFKKTVLFSLFLLSNLAVFNLATANSKPTIKLTVVVDGIRNQKGQICLRIHGDERGFPLSDTSEVKSGCVKIQGSSVKKEFSGLKPGTYAVAVVDDQNGDYKLNRDFLGMPQEGFGISKNPTVSMLKGVPKFQDASFSLKKDTTIRINMKYSLDP
ncbi:hypothetical protein PCC6912_24490 [Chlorogloeopsis fritschii PCC 6912]|uniref:DUF2141 domain-containing protein n=1 Tax=Chlorogloeopsis fritschii PCC 6912 TaxID=211165 RepID=A0A3S0XX37_CHLFR|nr:DUF2141 domain-containing protein [Chlorogloeopsis fritschii]MBF2004816.1 DUF2141 domain-containing protein [Chlorogloeopsis fritschii C42_A2020_084]RUR83075.1 hypothetical protein PCC6912_24490 [Chlorogloeopsis fritschii PCC 6912]